MAVLGVNFVALGLVGAAFFLLAVRWDFVLAAIPAVFALPAILQQPWMITIPFYAWLNRTGRLERAKSVLFHLPRRKLMLNRFSVRMVSDGAKSNSCQVRMSEPTKRFA